MRPANGSAIVFQTNAAAGAFSSAARATSAAALVDALERPVGRRRQVGDDGVEQLRDADVQQRRRADEREQLAGDRRAAQAGDQLLVGQRAGLEELLHQLLVGLGDHLDERLARRVDGRRSCRPGTGAFGELAALVGLEDERLLRDQIDDAAERLLLADRQLNRDDGAAARLAQRLRATRSRLARSRSSRLSTTRRGSAELVGRRPHLLGLHHRRRRRRRRRPARRRRRCSAARASLRKLPMPGVSMRLILCLFHSA